MSNYKRRRIKNFDDLDRREESEAEKGREALGAEGREALGAEGREALGAKEEEALGAKDVAIWRDDVGVIGSGALCGAGRKAAVDAFKGSFGAARETLGADGTLPE
jgi:hypothetical protein